MQRLLDIHFPANIKSCYEWLRTRQRRNWARGGGHKPIIPVLSRQKQGSSSEFPNSQGYTTRCCLKQTIKAKRKKEKRLITNLCLFVRTYTKRLEMLAHNRCLWNPNSETLVEIQNFDMLPPIDLRTDHTYNHNFPQHWSHSETNSHTFEMWRRLSYWGCFV